MTVVANLGRQCTVDAADAIDGVVDEFIASRQWPEYGFTHQAAIDEQLAQVTPARHVVPTILGLVLSTYWSEVKGSIAVLWRHLLSGARGRDRGATLQVAVPHGVADWARRIVAETTIRHAWYGRDIEWDATQSEVEITIPSYARRCGLCDSLEERLDAVPEFSQLFQPLDIDELRRSRSHAEIRTRDRKCLEHLLIAALRKPFLPPPTMPAWLANIAEEYVGEADIALKGAAPFPAIVLFGAAAECLLAWAVRSADLPVSSPSAQQRTVLRDVFNIGDLLSEATAQGLLPSRILARLQELRRLRNGIHANRYSEAVAMVGITDALRARELVFTLGSSVN